MKRALFVLPLLLVGCVVTQAPVLPPPDGEGTCETAFETASALGGCDLDLATFIKQCHDAEQAEAKDGTRYPVGCMTAARASCEQFWSCK